MPSLPTAVERDATISAGSVCEAEGHTPLGCHIGVRNLKVGGRSGYSCGNVIVALRKPPSLRGVRSVRVSSVESFTMIALCDLLEGIRRPADIKT